MGRSICVSGQLFLLDLIHGYLEQCKTVKVLQANTDGVLISVDDSELPKIHAVNREWEERTGFTLEEDKVRKVVQANVNNYIMVMLDGKVKKKGGYVTYGIAPAGAWNVNNDYTIVKKAIIDYFVEDKPVEDTVLPCDNIHEFQYIAKAGGKYSHVYHVVNGKEVEVQKVNRVYASTNWSYGTLYKVHKETGRPAKIGGLPTNCIIDNKNELTIEAVDKDHYVQKAKKMIDDYLGVKPKKVNRRKVNRVYATNDWSMGTLYKVHVETGRPTKIGGLPTNCIIDNKNELTIEAVDKDHYVQKAKKMIDDYLGIKPKRVNRSKVNRIKRELEALLEEEL